MLGHHQNQQRITWLSRTWVFWRRFDISRNHKVHQREVSKMERTLIEIFPEIAFFSGNTPITDRAILGILTGFRQRVIKPNRPSVNDLYFFVTGRITWPRNRVQNVVYWIQGNRTRTSANRVESKAGGYHGNCVGLRLTNQSVEDGADQAKHDHAVHGIVRMYAQESAMG